jgi:hypothetical protein
MKFSTVVLVLCALSLSGCSGAPSSDRAPAPSSAQSNTPPPAASPQPPAQTAPAQTPATGQGEIKALVFEDMNRNGVLDPGDSGVAGTPVAVLTSDAARDVTSAKTGGDGGSTFGKLPAGEYRMRFQIPPGYERTTDDSFVVTVVPDRAVEARFGVARRQ